MKAALAKALNRAAAAAASLTGKRFSLLVASSLVATSAIVVSALTGTGGNGALAALLGHNLASNNTPAATVPAGSPQPTGTGNPSAQSASGSAASAGGPLASPTPVPSPAASGPEDKPAKPSTPEAETPEAGRIKHVFVISLASPGYEATFGPESQMPYLANTLRPRGELLSNYSLLDPAGLPNAIAAIGGQPPNASTKANCTTYSEFPANSSPSKPGIVPGAGCVYPVEALTIADQLSSARLRWHAYVEGMVDATGKPDNCARPDPEAPTDQPAPGAYAARQNPFVYFHSLLDVGDCTTNDLPFDGLAADLRKANSAYSYSYVAPSLCHAGVPGQCPEGQPSGPAAADAFLTEWVPKILASPAYKKDGLLIVTFNELVPPDPAAPTPPPAEPPAAPLQVGALLFSRYALKGATDATPYDPYSLLRSVEDLFGLSHLAKANGAKVRSFAGPLLGVAGGD